MTFKKHLPTIWFLLGFIIFMFTRKSALVPTISFTILIAPIFILRFIRTQPAKRGIWLTLLGFILSMNIALWKLFEFDNASLMTFFSLIRSSLLAIVWFLPYMIDRLIYPKFKERGVLSTLTFPISVTAILLIVSLEGPFDSGGGTISKFLLGPLVLQQTLSLFGIWIFVFVYSWLISIINYFWENQFQWKKIIKPGIVYLSVLLLMFLFGVIKRTTFAPSETDTVKIAAIVLIPEDGKTVRMERIFHEKTTTPFEKTINRIESLTKKAAENDAKIVSFQEHAMIIKESDEERLRENFKRIARENKIYLSVTYAYFAKKGKGENIHLFVDDTGIIKLDYTKRYLLGFASWGENAVFWKGKEIIQSTQTPYGKIGIAICRDFAFSSFIKQAAKSDVDIMLGPSYDWPKSFGPAYRTTAIENGFSFVRPTYNGVSHATDYNGNVIATMDSEKTEDGIMYVDVPTKGVKTLFPIVGNFLGWICVVGMLALIFIGKFGKKRKITNT